MRTLYKCDSVTRYADWTSVRLTAASDGVTGHNEFTSERPIGFVELSVTSPGGGIFFVPGATYYLDFTPTGVPS